MSHEKTAAPFSVSEDMRVKMPLRVMVALLGVVAAGAIAWAVTTRNVADNTKRIESLEADGRTTREIMIRIDERTAAIKSRLDSGK